jgi:hypothetical protein
MQSKVLEEKEELIEKQMQWLKEKEDMKRVNQSEDEFVTINAGGTLL